MENIYPGGVDSAAGRSFETTAHPDHWLRKILVGSLVDLPWSPCVYFGVRSHPIGAPEGVHIASRGPDIGITIRRGGKFLLAGARGIGPVR